MGFISQIFATSRSIRLILPTGFGNSHRIFSALGVALLGWFPMGAIALQAQTLNAPLSAVLQTAICQNDWGTATQTVSRMMGDAGLSVGDRQRLLELRQQFSDYQLHQTSFDWSASPDCQAALSQTTTPAAEPQVATSSLNWERAAQSLGQTARPVSGSQRPSSSQASAGWQVSETPAQPSNQRANCQFPSVGDREVASGSISSRWTYEIFQVGTRNQFYTRYWPQNDCDAMRTTLDYPTQQGAYDAFRDIADRAAF